MLHSLCCIIQHSVKIFSTQYTLLTLYAQASLSIHLLHTPLYTFPFGKDKEHLFDNQSILSWQTFPLFMNDSAVLLYTKEKLNAKGFI